MESLEIAWAHLLSLVPEITWNFPNWAVLFYSTRPIGPNICWVLICFLGLCLYPFCAPHLLSSIDVLAAFCHRSVLVALKLRQPTF